MRTWQWTSLKASLDRHKPFFFLIDTTRSGQRLIQFMREISGYQHDSALLRRHTIENIEKTRQSTTGMRWARLKNLTLHVLIFICVNFWFLLSPMSSMSSSRIIQSGGNVKKGTSSSLSAKLRRVRGVPPKQKYIDRYPRYRNVTPVTPIKKRVLINREILSWRRSALTNNRFALLINSPKVYHFNTEEFSVFLGALYKSAASLISYKQRSFTYVQTGYLGEAWTYSTSS